MESGRKAYRFLLHSNKISSLGLSRGFVMEEKTRTIRITTEFITLGQLLKLASIISNGGQAKGYLLENEVLVNGTPDQRRGRKLRPRDEILTSGICVTLVA